MRRITPFFPFFVLLVSHFSLAISYPLPPEGSRLVDSLSQSPYRRTILSP